MSKSIPSERTSVLCAPHGHPTGPTRGPDTRATMAHTVRMAGPRWSRRLDRIAVMRCIIITVINTIPLYIFILTRYVCIINGSFRSRLQLLLVRSSERSLLCCDNDLQRIFIHAAHAPPHPCPDGDSRPWSQLIYAANISSSTNVALCSVD